MDTIQDATTIPLPTDAAEPGNLQVDTMNTNFTKTFNVTDYGPKQNETLDVMELMGDWVQGKNLPSLKSIFIGLAFAVHLVVDFFLDYFLQQVVFTLACAEAPHIVVPAPWTDKKSDDNDEVPQVQQERSITKSLRTTARHLYNVGGIFAFCRGMALHVALNSAVVVIVMPFFLIWAAKQKSIVEGIDSVSADLSFYAKLEDIGIDTAVEIITNLIFCSWTTAWVHIVITQPTLRIWYRRLPPFLPTLYATWRPMVLGPLVSILSFRLFTWVAKYIFGLYGDAEAEANIGTVNSYTIRLTLIWLCMQAMRLSVILPLEIATTRIQVSLLPEDEEPIVPLDRSFGANGSKGLRPGLLAEPRGPLSLKEAWRSLGWMEMRRLMKTFAKLLAVQAAMKAVFWLALGNDVWPSGWIPTRLAL